MSIQAEKKDESLVHQAADWFARLRSPELSEMDSTRFRAWLGRHRRHREEFDDLDQLWEELRALAPTSNAATQTREPVAVIRKWQWASLAATVLFAVGMIFWLVPDRSGRYTTDIGEQRSVSLSDGSVITLNTDTRLKVSYSDTSRKVELISGQANFNVALDPHRPFVVTADERQVTALGTSFDVYRSEERMTVTLLEGKVAVKERDAPDVALEPGQQISYDAHGGTARRTSVDIRRATAWRARRLEFDDTPIADAIADANRFSRQRIELDAPALEDAKVSGNFDAGDNEAFADALRTYYGLRVNRLQDGTILLSEEQQE